MIYWNKEGFKVGICKKPPTNQDYSILALCNSTGIKGTFRKMHTKFSGLYEKGIYKHHYEKFGATTELFEEAKANCLATAEEYEAMERESGKTITDEDIDSMRFKPLL